MPDLPLFRIFISSPGDVAVERNYAREVINELNSNPFIRDRAILRAVMWDDPDAHVPMSATQSAQEAVNEEIATPSQCEIVIVIFWSKMGTPLSLDKHQKPDGSAYLSGTEWEYLDAVNTAAKHPQGLPYTLLYWRDEEVLLSSKDPHYADKALQLQRVDNFFAQFKNPDGSIGSPYTRYPNADKFKDILRDDLVALVKRLLEQRVPGQSLPEKIVIEPTWTDSPFPGLRTFTPADEPIFFGRGRETAKLVSLVGRQKFVAIVGASGSGKSSLVGAGLLPKLAAGGDQWVVLRFTPGEVGDNPFMALASALVQKLGGGTTRTIATEIAADPAHFVPYLERLPASEVLLFIDQFEELFTLVSDSHRAPFVNFILWAEQTPRIRMVATLRMDFLERTGDLGRLFEGEKNLNLYIPDIFALREMIERPAACAGLRFEDGLIDRILADTYRNREPGALALMAYLLDELYRQREQGGLLALSDYETLGGVKGAINQRAESAFQKLSPAAQDALPFVFRHLIEVDSRGTATRQRVDLAVVQADPGASQLVAALVDARLLVTDAADGTPHLEVAHEAMLTYWDRLADWIDGAKDDLLLLARVREAAHEWDANGRKKSYLWDFDRQEQVYTMLERLPDPLDAVTQAFLTPQYAILLQEFQQRKTSRSRRQVIVEELVAIGVKAVPFLLEVLGNPSDDADVRQAAARALEQIGSDGAMSVLVDVVRNTSDDRYVRSSTAGALGQIGSDGAMSVLVDVVRNTSDDRYVRLLAAGALGQIGSDGAVSVLVGVVGNADDHTDVRSSAAGALGQIGSDGAVSVLVGVVGNADDHMDVRSSAAEALGQIGSEAAVSVLAGVVGNVGDNVEVRSSAAAALGEIGSEAAVSVLLSVEANTSENANVRGAAAVALRLLDVPVAIATWIEALNASYWHIQFDAVNALGDLGGVEALSALRATALEKDILGFSSSQIASLTLAQLRDLEWFPLLAKQPDDIEQIALWLLGQHHLDIQPAVQRLLTSITHSVNQSSLTLVTNIKALGLLREPTAVPPLIALLEHQDRHVQYEAFLALERIATPEALAAAQAYRTRWLKG